MVVNAQLPDSFWDSHIPLTSTIIFAAVVIYVFSQHKSSARVSPGKVGIETSNLADEFKYTPKGTHSPWRVKSLWIFPLKSARGIEVDQIEVHKTGFQYDRQFMIAEWEEDPKTGESRWLFCTQRRNPKMALIHTELYVNPSSETGGTLRVSFPAGKSRQVINVPISATFPGIELLPQVPASIWKDDPLCYDLGPLYKRELEQLGEFLEARGRVTLLRASPSNLREVYRCAPKKEELGYQSVITFADAYPLHLVNIASIRELNGRVASSIENLTARRFRANIIVEGPEAYNEDDWKFMEIGGEKYYASCRTVRCKLPNVDPETGIRNPNEPDVTMRKYRVVDPGHKTGACMGLQMVPVSTKGVMKVGDEVKILERGEHFYINQ